MSLSASSKTLPTGKAIVAGIITLFTSKAKSETAPPNMSTSITTTQPPREEDNALAFIGQPSPEALQAALAEGRIEKLTIPQRLEFLAATCKSVGLNPITRPFEFITLQGRMVMYARKDATDQLRAMKTVSIKIVSREIMGDVLMVTARAVMPSGREDEAIGAVPWPKGAEPQAMAAMKAETKAKRRVTLSICGLGFLDESEIEDAQLAEHFSERDPSPTMPQSADVVPAQPRQTITRKEEAATAPATTPEIPVEVMPPNDKPQESAENNIDEVLLDIFTKIGDAADANDLNSVLADCETLEAAVSKKAAWNALTTRAKVLNCKFDKTRTCFK